MSIIFPSFMSAQDLDPRAYARVPINMTFLGVGFNYTYGNVILDQSLSLKDLDAKLKSPVIDIGYTYDLFGFTSQVFAAIPYAWVQTTGEYEGNSENRTRSGLGDMRMRISVLFIGANPVTVEEFVKKTPKFVLGASLMIYAPTGQFFSDKVINIGTNRWSFKPEIGISYPFFKNWFVDLYAGAWFFTNNDEFFPGNSVRKQNPLGSFQLDLSYNFNPAIWASVNVTYYTGGQSSINAVKNNDYQNNLRVGATFNLPISKSQLLKFAYSTGAIIRFGADFSTISAGWQYVFL